MLLAIKFVVRTKWKLYLKRGGLATENGGQCMCTHPDYYKLLT